MELLARVAKAHLNICVSSRKRASRKLGIAKWKDWRELPRSCDKHAADARNDR